MRRNSQTPVYCRDEFAGRYLAPEHVKEIPELAVRNTRLGLPVTWESQWVDINEIPINEIIIVFAAESE